MGVGALAGDAVDDLGDAIAEVGGEGLKLTV
jgi:hypothetical protein